VFRGCVPGGELRLTEAREEAKLRYTVEHYPKAYIGTLRSLVFNFLRACLPGANSLWRLAGQITAPILVVGRELDRLVDVRVAAPRGLRAIPANNPAGSRSIPTG